MDRCLFKACTKLEGKLTKKWDHAYGRGGGGGQMAALFGCKVRSLPTSYLALPRGAIHSHVVLDLVLERFKKKSGPLKEAICLRKREG